MPGDDDNEDRDDDDEEGDAQKGDEGSALWGLDAASRGEYSIGFRSFERKTALPGSHLKIPSTKTGPNRGLTEMTEKLERVALHQI